MSMQRTSQKQASQKQVSPIQTSHKLDVIAWGKAHRPKVSLAIVGAIALLNLTAGAGRTLERFQQPQAMGRNPAALQTGLQTDIQTGVQSNPTVDKLNPFQAEDGGLDEAGLEKLGAELGLDELELEELVMGDHAADDAADDAPENVLEHPEHRDRITAQLSALESLVDDISDPKYKGQVWRQFAHIYGKVGDRDRALAALHNAQTVAVSSEHWIAIASLYGELEEDKHTLRSLKTAEALISADTIPLYYSWVGLAQAYQSLEKRDQAINALSQGEKAAVDAGELEGHPPITFRLMWIAQLYGKWGAKDQASKTLAASLAASEDMENPTLRVSALMSLGRIAGEVGDRDRMVEILEAVQTHMNAIESDQARAFHWVGIGRIYQEFAESLGTGELAVAALETAQKAVGEISGESWARSNVFLHCPSV